VRRFEGDRQAGLFDDPQHGLGGSNVGSSEGGRYKQSRDNKESHRQFLPMR
jgi:hypothetical protein